MVYNNDVVAFSAKSIKTLKRKSNKIQWKGDFSHGEMVDTGSLPSFDGGNWCLLQQKDEKCQ